MTTELFEATPAYEISGTGPYAILSGYGAGDIVVRIGSAQGLVTVDPINYTLSPTIAESGGNLTLNAAYATEQAGNTLYISRNTNVEQGWEGQSSRERGLEAQLDALTRGVQDAKQIGSTAIRTVSTQELDPLDPLPDSYFGFDENGQPVARPDVQVPITAALAAQQQAEAAQQQAEAAQDAAETAQQGAEDEQQAAAASVVAINDLLSDLSVGRQLFNLNVTQETALLAYNIPSDINEILIKFEKFAPTVDGSILQLGLGTAGANGAFNVANEYVNTQIFSNDGVTADANILTTSAFALTGVVTNSNPLLTANGGISLRGFNDASNEQVVGEMLCHYVSDEPRNSFLISGFKTLGAANWNAIRFTASGASNIATLKARIVGLSHG